MTFDLGPDDYKKYRLPPNVLQVVHNGASAYIDVSVDGPPYIGLFLELTVEEIPNHRFTQLFRIEIEDALLIGTELADHAKAALARDFDTGEQ